MSPETPDVYHASFIRKSLAAVSKLGHPSSAHAPADVPIRKPTIQSHRIFNLHLSRLKTSSPPRLGSKVGADTHKSTDHRVLVDVDGSTSLDEDDSIYTEQNSDVFNTSLEHRDDDHSDLGLNDSLVTNNSATDLPLAHGSAASPQTLLPPPGLEFHCPQRYPIIIPTRKNVVPRPGVVPPKHWAPGGGCNVRIEPEPTMHFLPRPGTIPPSYWTPGGRATRLEEPARDSFVSQEGGLDQDDTDGTKSNSISAASLNDPAEKHGEGTLDSPLNDKDHIHVQLEHIYNMDDVVFNNAVLPGVDQSVWATCPTPPPSPDHSRPHLSRKESHALLNYLIFECGFDWESLSKLEARLPVPKRDPDDVPELDEGHAPDFTDVATNYDLQIRNKETPAASTMDENRNVLFQQTSQTLDALQKRDEPSVTMCAIEKVLEDDECADRQPAVPELSDPSTGERARTPEVVEIHANEVVALIKATVEGLHVAEITALQPSVSIVHANTPTAKALLVHSKLPVEVNSRIPARSPVPLRRIRSLPAKWRVSTFTIFDQPTSPPSPTPAPKPRAKKMYLQPAAISSVESLAAPVQSGHSYVRSMNQTKTKTKTRPATATERSVVAPVKITPSTRKVKKASSMSQLFNRGNDEEEKPKASAKPGKWFSKISKMSKVTADRMRVLAKCGPNARGMTWKDFLKIMKELGFTCDEMDGTAVKFYPPDSNDPTITFHRPHEKVWNIKKLSAIRKQLAETYGWTEDILAALGVDN